MSTGGVKPGVYCPLVTPFDYQEEIYLPKLRHNVTRLNQVGLAGYVVGTRIGEGDMLTLEERRELWQTVAEVAAASAKPKVLIAATCQPSVRACLLDLEQAGKLGYTAAIVDSPDDFLIRCVADRAPLPVVHGRLTAPPASNAVPYAYVTIFEAERSRETEAAEDWRQRLQPVEAVVERYGIAAIKAAMDRYGFYGGAPRLPRVRLTPAAVEEVAKAFAEIRS